MRHKDWISSHNKLPRGIWALGLVSLFMDISSELVHSLLPLYMTSVLGASIVVVGVIEGVAESAAAITKVFSGWISDYLGKRKILAVVGYGLAALTKPIFPLATSIEWVFTARLVDRIGKGIRGAPRDALVADIAPLALRGAAYGLRQALDSVGAFLGPLLAVLFMFWFADAIRAVLWIAVLPAFLAVTLLIFAVHEPVRKDQAAIPQQPVKWRDVRNMSTQYWLIVLLGAVFTLARFSEAFLLLRGQDIGMALGYLPLVLVVMNIVYALSAYPAGAAADRLNRSNLMIAGLGVLILADILLAMGSTVMTLLLGSALWGLHMGLTQGLLAKLVADAVPAQLRGTAFGFFNLVSGVALLLASSVAGTLWHLYGAPMTFISGAVFAGTAMISLMLYRIRWRNTRA